jgi:uncharacterized RDD family membrane protein YckC
MGIPNPVEDSQFYDGVVMRRLVAFCIDLVVVLLLWCIVLVVGLLVTVLTLGIATPLALAVFGAADFLYRWAMLAERSATVGMLATGIEVRDAGGSRLNPIVAFLHVTGFYLSFFVTPLLVIGWVLMASSPHRRLLHDLALGTVVINRPA